MKNTLITIFILLFSAIIGGVLYIFTFDINSYKGRIEKFLLDTTGYSISIQGKMLLSKSLNPTLTITDVEIKNATGFSEPVFLKAKRADISFDLIPFLKNVINVQDIFLHDVDVFLQVNEAGHDNWTRIPRTQRVETVKKDAKRPTLSKAAAMTPASQAQFDLITMNGLNIHYLNEQNKAKNIIFVNKMTIDHLVNVDGDALFNNEKFTFSGSVKNLVSVFVNRRDLNFSFTVNGLNGTSKISGVCRDLSRCSDNITLNINSRGKSLKQVYAFFAKEEDKKAIPDTAYSFQIAGRLLRGQMLLDGVLDLTDEGVNVTYNVEQNFESGIGKGRINLDIIKPDILKQFALNPFSVQANYQIELGKSLDISNISAMFDETDIDGSLKVDLSTEKPFVLGKLHSHYFKLSNIFERNPVVAEDAKKTADAEKTANAETLFSTKKIDLDWLDKIDTNLSVVIDNFSVNNLFARYPVVMANININNSVLDVRLLEGSSIASGQIVGKLVLDAKDKQNPAWDLELVGEGLMFNQINKWKKQILSGSFSMNLFLNAKGDMQKAMLSSLGGKALLEANQVEILSPVVADLFAENDTNGSYKASRDLFIKCAVLNADVKDGVISLDKNVAVETSRFNMLMDGNINLDGETLDIRFIPQKPSVTRAGQNIGTIRGVALSGPLDDPKPRIEANVTPSIDLKKEKVVDTNNKKAVLDAYTAKKTADGVSICRIASADMKLKSIDDYFGRAPIFAVVEEAPKPEKAPEETKAQKFGRELLNTFSDVLSDKDEKPSRRKP